MTVDGSKADSLTSPGRAGLESFERFFLDVRDDLGAIAYLYTGDSEEARDLVQETLARAWQHWEKLSAHPNAAAWTRTVLHNLAVSRWRRHKLEQSTRRHMAGGIREVNVDHLDVLVALSKLPPKLRRALVLHDVAGLSVAEVSVELEAPEGTVRSWLSRARNDLARALGTGKGVATSKPGRQG